MASDWVAVQVGERIQILLPHLPTSIARHSKTVNPLDMLIRTFFILFHVKNLAIPFCTMVLSHPVYTIVYYKFYKVDGLLSKTTYNELFKRLNFAFIFLDTYNQVFRREKK